MITKIEKRDGRTVRFDVTKIGDAIYKAASSVGGSDKTEAYRLALDVVNLVEQTYPQEIPSVEFVQDAVEKTLIESGHAKTAKAYILYRTVGRVCRILTTAWLHMLPKHFGMRIETTF